MRLTTLAFLVVLFSGQSALAADPELVEVRKIWERAPHNAFTDLLRFQDRWFCVFREGQAHVSPDGALRVLVSSNGEKWESVALVTSPTSDLRDAKISVTPDGQLMLGGAEALHKKTAVTHQSLAWFSRDGSTWSRRHEVGDPNYWLWRVTWHKGKAYGIGYGCGQDQSIRLYSSKDGKEFEVLIERLYDAGRPNESSLVFDQDTCYCLLRRDGNPSSGLIGTARAPYTNWQWKDLAVRIGGPTMTCLPDGRFVAAVRLYDGKVRTSLCWVDPQAGKLSEFLKLPSGGDTGYAGLVWHENLLWVSYYSSHEGKASIYLAKVRLPAVQPPKPAAKNSELEYIDTSIENASPLWHQVAGDGTIEIHLNYDHERSSPNRAAGHIHFQLQAKPGARLTLEFKNLDDIYNGKRGSIARELKSLLISPDGKNWQPAATRALPGERVLLDVEMPGTKLYVARVEPYRLSDLEKWLASIKSHALVEITPIGKTAEGRELEIVRVGNARAPYHVFLRARAHPWEAGGNWVVEGLVKRLLKGDDDARLFLKRYCVYVLPMANKDGVARGRSRFNLHGKDLNRNWDRPADATLAPENDALESWLKMMIQKGRRPSFALELHNDGNGKVHVSQPPPQYTGRYLDRMKDFESLLRKHTWFTEGFWRPASNVGTLADGWLDRYGIDAVVHEFNCQWIAGLKEPPTRRHWERYGEDLARVFYEYFPAGQE